MNTGSSSFPLSRAGFDPSAVYGTGDGFTLGDADLFVGGITEEVIGRAAAFLFLAVRNQQGERLFRGITVIAPPLTVWPHTDEALLKIITEGLQTVLGRPLQPSEPAILRARLHVVRCEQLNVDLALKAVRAAPSNQLCCIIEAAMYRDSTLTPALPQGQTAFVLDESLWVPHVASLASKCLALIETKDSYLLLETPELPPAAESNRQQLFEVQRLYPFYFEYGRNPGALLAANASRWTGLAVTGRVEEALAEIEQADITPSYKYQLQIQIVARSGNHERAAQLIRAYLDQKAGLTADIGIRLARISMLGDDYPTAQRLLTDYITRVADVRYLEVALATATTIRDAALVTTAYERLLQLHPTSEYLRENRESRLLLVCRASQAVMGDGISRVGFEAPELYLAQELGTRSDIDYASLLHDFAQLYPLSKELDAVCCATHALAHDRAFDAIQLAVPIATKRFEKAAVQIIVLAMRRMMLHEELPESQLEFYNLPLIRILKYLATHPEDGQLRWNLSNVLSVEACGSIGLPLLAALGLRLTRPSDALASRERLRGTSLSEDRFSAFFERAMQFLASLPAVELGVTRIPTEMFTDEPREILAFLTEMLRHMTLPQSGETDLIALERIVYLACLVAAQAGDEREDLEMLRLFANKCWLEGKAQKARDLAEQILLLSSSAPDRARYGWACFGDLYQRMHKPMEALIAISTAAICTDQSDPYEVWHETHTLIRICRDIELYSHARRLLDDCRSLPLPESLNRNARRRLKSMELGLRLHEVSRAHSTAIDELLIDLDQHLREAADRPDELLHAASLLASAIQLAQSSGTTVPGGIKDALNSALSTLGPDIAKYLATVASTAPSADDVLAVCQRLDTTRYSEDRPSDYHPVTMVARNLLGSGAAADATTEVAFALELMADKSIELSSVAQTPTIGWAADYIRHLSGNGIVVLMMGLTASGNLIALVANDGELELQRSAPSRTPFRDRLHAWSERYPYRYGWIDRNEGNNEFYVSMTPLDIPLPVAGSLLIITEPTLSQIPAHLLLRDGEFLGLNTAIGTVPSLTWLDAATRSPANSDRRRVSWISTSDDPNMAGTLEIIRDRLDPMFERFRFERYSDRRIPTGFSNAQIAVICAHGGLATEERYLHRISDEGSLKEPPLALARALAGVELVILFVCSGGRLDKHPLDNTSVGLPKMLLSRGCRAVLASPWPLSANVPGHWLPSFLTAWESGETVMAAAFAANQAVRTALGEVPQYHLAMAVYGDVLLRRS